MSQRRLEGGENDPIASICNGNFDELYAAESADAIAIAAAQADATAALNAGKPFRVTGILTAAAAGTAIHVLTDAQVGAGKKAYLTGMILSVNGATPWTDVTATLVKVQDTNVSPLIGPTVPKALLIASANIGLTSLTVTLGNAVARGTGFTTAKGLDILADANFAAGSDIYVTLIGYIV